MLNQSTQDSGVTLLFKCYVAFSIGNKLLLLQWGKVWCFFIFILFLVTEKSVKSTLLKQISVCSQCFFPILQFQKDFAKQNCLPSLFGCVCLTQPTLIAKVGLDECFVHSCAPKGPFRAGVEACLQRGGCATPPQPWHLWMSRPIIDLPLPRQLTREYHWRHCICADSFLQLSQGGMHILFPANSYSWLGQSLENINSELTGRCVALNTSPSWDLAPLAVAWRLPSAVAALEGNNLDSNLPELLQQC